MVRARGVSGKLVAAVIAGAIGFGYAGRASAQPKPATPAAQPAKPAAKVDPKKAYSEGEKKFKAGDYAGALVAFQAADSVKATPHAARYIGLCQDNLGHYQEAVAAYERFLANVPPKLAPQAEEVKKRVEAIKAIPGRVHVESTPPGATITVDGKPAPTPDGKPAPAPTPTDLDLPPGKHTIEFSAEGRVPQEKEIDVTYASKQDVSVMLEEKPAPPPPPPPPPEPVAAPTPPAASPTQAAEAKGSSTVPALITGGLAVAALGVGTVFGVMALQDKSDFDKNPTSSKADDGENHALIADMAFGVAVTLGVTSAVLFFSGGSSASSAQGQSPAAKADGAKVKGSGSRLPISVTPIVTPHGGGAGATLQF